MCRDGSHDHDHPIPADWDEPVTPLAPQRPAGPRGAA